MALHTRRMPFRRPSAAGHIQATGGAGRHRTNESQHILNQPAAQVPPNNANAPAYSLAGSGSAQQKIVQVLVNRLKNKLPCYSGLPLDEIERDQGNQQAIQALVELSNDSLDVIAWALCEQLDRLSKQTDSQGHLTSQVLQSQLFVLKVLSLAMASRWNQYREDIKSGVRSNKQPITQPDSPHSGHMGIGPNHQTKSGRNPQAPSEQSSSSFSDAPPLDDNCARYVLSVMVSFLRQTSRPEPPLLSRSDKSVDTSFKDFDILEPTEALINCGWSCEIAENASHFPEPQPRLRPVRSSGSFTSPKGTSTASMTPIPVRSTKYEKTHGSLVASPFMLNDLIAKMTARIVYHLSVSNWGVVFQRLRTKIHFLAQTSEENPDTMDLHLMAHSALHRHKLIQVLVELSSLLVTMKRELQAMVAIPLRVAIWNWIEVFPQEFNEAVRSRGRLEGAPERVFDFLCTKESGTERWLWPTLMILNCISTERLSADFEIKSFTGCLLAVLILIVYIVHC